MIHGRNNDFVVENPDTRSWRENGASTNCKLSPIVQTFHTKKKQVECVQNDILNSLNKNTHLHLAKHSLTRYVSYFQARGIGVGDGGGGSPSPMFLHREDFSKIYLQKLN